MVEKFKNILLILEDSHEVFMFALLKMDDFVDKWSVVVSAEGLDENDDKSFDEVFELFNKTLSVEERNSIARLGIFNKGNYIPTLFSKYKTGDEINEETKINGFTVYKGYILKSNY